MGMAWECGVQRGRGGGWRDWRSGVRRRWGLCEIRVGGRKAWAGGDIVGREGRGKRVEDTRWGRRWTWGMREGKGKRGKWRSSRKVYMREWGGEIACACTCIECARVHSAHVCTCVDEVQLMMMILVTCGSATNRRERSE